MSTRRQARILVLKALYAYEIMARDLDELFDGLVAEDQLDDENMAFARHYVALALEHIVSIDEKIKVLADNWEIERIALIDKTILRMALCELYYMPEIPEKAAINEAIDLAKMYSTHESSAFVNGLLDAAFNKNDFPGRS